MTSRPKERLDPVTGELIQERDRFFDPWRVPASPAAKALVDEVVRVSQAAETVAGLRRRRRRPADQDIFERTVAAIICDLAHATLTGDGEIAVPRSNRVLGRKSRYRPAALGKTLPETLDLLSRPEVGFVRQQIGEWHLFGRNQRTLVRPGPKLMTRLEDLAFDGTDFARDRHQEIIILKAPKTSEPDRPDLAEYEDSAETVRMRSDLRGINDFIEGSDIQLLPEWTPDTAEAEQRRLRRVFTYGSFQSGGRLFGGFWQELKKDTRRHGLRIEGEATIELDYSQMAPRLLYASIGKAMRRDDAYILDELHVPGLFREGVKKLFNAMLFATEPLKRKPQGTRQKLPNLSIGELTAMVIRAHQPVAELFFTGIGHRLQFEESELMVELLVRAKQERIVALPIHDAIIVKRSMEEQARSLMTEVFEKRTGSVSIIRAS